MKTDRELLELAAKAAGIAAHRGDGWQADMMFRAIPRPNSPLVSHVEWNPLTDDGDALRLAVKLNLIVECMTGQSAARTFDSQFAGACDYPAPRSDGCLRDFAPDCHAATRRAIVRAAAEIGASA